MADAIWTIDRQTATFQTGEVRGSLELTQPGQGVRALCANNQSIEGLQWFGLRLANAEMTEQAPDAWHIRQADLVATYPQTDARPFAVEVYWRVIAASDPDVLAEVELWVSTETDLLDSSPEVSVVTGLPQGELVAVSTENSDASQPISLTEGEVTHEGVGCFVYRPVEASYSVIDLIEPSSYLSTSFAATDSGMQACHRLMHPWFEKGVILRSRTRSLIVRRENDLQTAARVYRKFVNADLPLTA